MKTIRLALGTAQLGMPYGVGRRGRTVTARDAQEILSAALALGVEEIDTAPAYGIAETIVGAFLREPARGPGFRICTKTPVARDGSGASAADRSAMIRESLLGSCERLGVAGVHDLLVHSIGDLRDGAGAAVVAAMDALRTEGRTVRLGASLYDVADADLVLTHPQLSVTQLPFSVFNRTLVDAGVVRRLRAAGHEIAVRSVLQQGLVVLTADEADDAAPGSGQWIERFRDVCARHDVTPLHAAVAYAVAAAGADVIVVGADSAAQLAETVRALHDPLPADALRDLEAELSGVPPEIMDPRRWPAPAAASHPAGT